MSRKCEKDRSQHCADFSSDHVTADYLTKLAYESVRMEDERGKDLVSYAGYLLTGISIIVVALVTVAEPLFSFFPEPWHRVVLAAAYMSSTLCYAAGFILCLLALNRRKYRVLNSPKSISDRLEGTFSCELEAARTLCESLEAYYSSRAANNNKTVALLCKANILVLIATGVAVFFLVFFTVVGFVLMP